MLHYILYLFFVTGVLSDVTNDDVPDSACLKLSDFKSIVSVDDVKRTQWTAFQAKKKIHCRKFNIGNFTTADVEHIKEACADKKGPIDLPAFDYTKTVKKIYFEEHSKDYLMSYQDGAYYVGGIPHRCNLAAKTEFRQFGGNYIWLAWDPKYKLHYTVAIQVAEDETWTCIIQDYTKEERERVGEKHLPPKRIDFCK